MILADEDTNSILTDNQSIKVLQLHLLDPYWRVLGTYMGKHGVCMYCVQTKQTNCPKYGSQVFSMGARCVHCTDSTHSKLLLSLHKDDITTLGWRWATELMATTFLDLRKGSKVSFSLSLDQSTNPTNYTTHLANPFLLSWWRCRKRRTNAPCF